MQTVRTGLRGGRLDHTSVIRGLFRGKTGEVRKHDGCYEVLLTADGRVTEGTVSSLEDGGLRITSVDVSGVGLRIMLRDTSGAEDWPDHKTWHSKSPGMKGRVLLEM